MIWPMDVETQNVDIYRILLIWASSLNWMVICHDEKPSLFIFSGKRPAGHTGAFFSKGAYFPEGLLFRVYSIRNSLIILSGQLVRQRGIQIKNATSQGLFHAYEKSFVISVSIGK